MLFSLATLTRGLTGSPATVRRCSSAWKTGTGTNGQRLTLHRATVRAQGTRSSAAQTTWQLPGPATQSADGHVNLQGAQTTARDRETAAPHAGSPTLSRPVARAGTWCSARRTSTSGSAFRARFGRQMSASWD